MSNKPALKYIIEAALLAADEPLSINRISDLFAEDAEQPNKDAIKQALNELINDYAERSMECVELASGYSIRVKKEYAEWVSRLWELKPARYSRAFLETLALIAYKQPITRTEIEQVRGVAVNSQIIKTLLDKEWVKIVGHRDLPGKPAVLATTKIFLDYFNLKNLEDLPPLSEIKDLDKAGDQLEMQLQQAMGDVLTSEVYAEEPQSIIEVDADSNNQVDPSFELESFENSEHA